MKSQGPSSPAILSGPSPLGSPSSKLVFSSNSDFHVELRRRVDEFFRSTGRRKRDCPQMYVKTAILFAAFMVSYVLLVFVVDTWWQALLLAMVVGLATATIGLNVQHDGGHQAFSNHARVNAVMAMTLDMIGASSYLWRWKHGILHHTYVNITGHDHDIDIGGLGRLSPHQRRLRFHGWQHWYLWPLYGIMVVRWQLVGDFREIVTGRIGTHRFPRPKGWDFVIFVAGKLTFLALAFGIPLLVHGPWVVLVYYGVVEIVLGLLLSVVFLLAHCVEQADFPLPSKETGRVENAWAIHQVEASVDFARRSRVAAWLLGGLNFQIEHHLFPRICHTNYPAISTLVEDTCREYGVRYREHASIWAGVVSHFRWLRQMGLPPATSLLEE